MRSVILLAVVADSLSVAPRRRLAGMRALRRPAAAPRPAAARAPATGAATGGCADGDDDAAVPPLLRGRSPAGAVVAVAWPSVAIGLLRTALGQIDAWYIGRLGSAELQAVGAASFGVWMVYLLGEVGAVGVQSLSSEAEGAGDRRGGVGAAVTQGAYFSLIAAALAFALAADPLVAAYLDYLRVTDPAVRAAASSYLVATAKWGGLPLCLDAVAFAGFKGVGETRAALKIAAMAVLLNIVLNGPAIAAFGVAGAAYATNVAAAVAAVVGFSALRRRGVDLAFRATPSKKMLKKIVAIGAPVGASGALFTVAYVLMGRTLAGLSATALAALAVGHRIEAVAYTVCEGYCVGVATVVGQWRGAGRRDRGATAAHEAARLGALSMVPVALGLHAFAFSAARVFAPDVAVASMAADYLRVVSFCVPFMAVDAVYDGACVGAQDTRLASICGVVANLGRVPLAAVLASTLGLGVTGVWLSISLSTMLKAPLKWACFSRTSRKT